MEIIKVVNKHTLKVEKVYKLSQDKIYKDYLLKGIFLTFDDRHYYVEIKTYEPINWQ